MGAEADRAASTATELGAVERLSRTSFSGVAESSRTVLGVVQGCLRELSVRLLPSAQLAVRSTNRDRASPSRGSAPSSGALPRRILPPSRS